MAACRRCGHCHSHKNLTARKKEVLFLSAVRLCTAAQIACYKDQTDRAVRKLLTAALDAVYLPKNHFIREESMTVDEYAALFFPFEKPDFTKTKEGVRWNVSGDREMLALAATLGKSPMAMNMSFQREYAERYDWLATQFKDWAFTFVSSFIYYEATTKLTTRPATSTVRA